MGPDGQPDSSAGPPPTMPVPVAAPSPVGAGWQPDPQRRAEYRWWDGTTWTSQVAVAGRTFDEDPAVALRALTAERVLWFRELSPGEVDGAMEVVNGAGVRVASVVPENHGQGLFIVRQSIAGLFDVNGVLLASHHRVSREPMAAHVVHDPRGGLLGVFHRKRFATAITIEATGTLVGTVEYRSLDAIVGDRGQPLARVTRQGTGPKGKTPPFFRRFELLRSVPVNVHVMLLLTPFEMHQRVELVDASARVGHTF